MSSIYIIVTVIKLPAYISIFFVIFKGELTIVKEEISSLCCCVIAEVPLGSGLLCVWIPKGTSAIS